MTDFIIKKQVEANETTYPLEIGGIEVLRFSETDAEKLVDMFANLGIVPEAIVFHPDNFTAPPQTEPAPALPKPDPSLAYLEAALQIQGQHIQDLRDQIQDARAFIQILVNRGLKAAPTKRFDNV